ncbi:MAG: peptide-methionine (R)-S-oxide reductase MsrB [Coriobacteriia bacterium]|nr:peptide-methionine (R)-S-oxide reductase MsrB [Coriobacteriia bacterium]
MQNTYEQDAFKKTKKIYLAAGCFWGAQAYFKLVRGVVDTRVAYANGISDNTDYYRIKQTDHAETLMIEYNPHVVHLAELLDRFYSIIDATSLNKQGNDRGRQYRVGIYWEPGDTQTEKIVRLSHELLNEELNGRSVIELNPLENLVYAEDYHQDYLDKNPQGYCHINIAQVNDLLYPGKQQVNEAHLKETLDELSYQVTQDDATERPFSHPYNDLDEEGVYVDIVSGQPLFSSLDKFDAGCGWPSFTKTITTDALNYLEDDSLNMKRIEVRGSDSNSHQGHVFTDGPHSKGGLRYCINGAALRFVPKSAMTEAGYSRLLPYLLENV